MTTQNARYVSPAEGAKMVRAQLKKLFPGTKFSVRSKSYSGGASISVRWTDGPVHDEVRAATRAFTGSTFDPMIDLKSHHTTLLANEDGSVEHVSFAADYVSCQRDLSDEYRAQLRDELVYFAAKTFKGEPEAIAAADIDGWDNRNFEVIFETAKGGRGVDGSLPQIIRSYADQRDSVTELALQLRS